MHLLCHTNKCYSALVSVAWPNIAASSFSGSAGSIFDFGTRSYLMFDHIAHEKGYATKPPDRAHPNMILRIKDTAPAERQLNLCNVPFDGKPLDRAEAYNSPE